jgi:hypothetical protein
MQIIERQQPSLLSEMRNYRKRQAPRDNYWLDYGSSLQSYKRTFAGVLKGTSIEDLLREKKSPVVLDLMAPSDTLVDLFSQLGNLPDKIGIAVSLEDQRDDLTKQRDSNVGVFQIAGDLGQNNTWNEIERALEGNEIDLIIERGEGGIYHLPSHEEMYAIMLSRMWNMLSANNGTMLIQIPAFVSLDSRRIRYREWFEILNRVNATLDINTPNCNILKLVKTPNSPKKIPLLPRQ